ncbi:MAG: hypothetical protein SFV32_01875 [Opitutaceae bacterium]|nr:hypothetical protein [Opitutaceae bacterium]
MSLLCVVAALIPSPPLRGQNPVMTLPLDGGRVTQVPTHVSLALLVEFPEPITDYAGRGFTEDATTHAGEFLLRWGMNDPYLVVAPLVEGARAILHVVVAGRSYVLEFMPTARDLAWAKLVFTLNRVPTETGSFGGGSEVVRAWRGRGPLSRPPADDPAAWLSVVEQLRAFLELEEAQVNAILRADPGLTLSRRTWSQVAGSCLVTGNAVLRSEELDTVVLSVRVSNPTARPVRFLAGSLLVRCGVRLYPVVITDWPAELRPGESTRALVAIAGDGLGRRNQLSVDNEFRISLAEADVDDPQPSDSP